MSQPKWRSKLLHIVVALALVFGLAAAVAPVVSKSASTPALANGQDVELRVDVRAYTKSSGDFTPLSGCLSVDDEFYINAIVVNDGTITASDILASIAIAGPASLVEGEVPDKNLGSCEACLLVDGWWKLKCDGPGSVTITVDATDEGGQGSNTGSGSTVVSQCGETPTPCLIVEIFECPGCCPCEPTGTQSVVECQNFGVKAYITNDCDYTLENVTGEISWTPTGLASIVGGDPLTWNVGDMAPGHVEEVGWTLHCEGPGAVTITVDAHSPTIPDSLVTHDTCTVDQKGPAKLVVTIDDIDDEICSYDCEDPIDWDDFFVSGSVQNIGDVTALGVTATITQSAPPGGASIEPPPLQSLFDLDPGDIGYFSWPVHCTGPGPVTFTVLGSGWDAETDPAEQVTHSDSVTVQQKEFLVDLIVEPQCNGTTFSNLQYFNIRASLRNCTGENLTNLTAVLDIDPPTGAHIVSAPDMPFDICRCCECEILWVMQCDSSDEVTFTVTILDSTGQITLGTATATATQEWKTHLVVGLDSFIQGYNGIMLPRDAVVPGQDFHVTIPVFNTGEAQADDVYVRVLVPALNTGEVTLQSVTGDFIAVGSPVSGGDPAGEIIGYISAIPGGEARKMILRFTCEAEGDVTFEILEEWNQIFGEVIGTGDDIATVFSNTLASLPIAPGSLTVTDGVETFTDNGNGTLTLHGVGNETPWTGDGTTTDFGPTSLANLPIVPGSLTITDGVETFTDNGDGTLTSDFGSAGTIDYDTTGDVQVSFDTAPLNLASIDASYLYGGTAGNTIDYMTGDVQVTFVNAPLDPVDVLASYVDGYGVWGYDHNTCEPIHEDNMCIECPLLVRQIPLVVEWIQPISQGECDYQPSDNYTVKVKIANLSTEGEDLSNIIAELFWMPGDPVELVQPQSAAKALGDFPASPRFPDELIATGDTSLGGGTGPYTGFLEHPPIVPGSLTIEDPTGDQTVTDTDNGDGTGTLGGDGSGTIDYMTGEFSVTFNTGLGDDDEILAEYWGALVWHEITWELHCTGKGNVNLWVRVTSEDPALTAWSENAPDAPTVTVTQCEPVTCLEVEILSPDWNTFIATGQEFAVTARVTNIGCPTDGPNMAYNVMAKLFPVPCDAADVDGQLVHLGDMAYGQSEIVTWTVECREQGLTGLVAVAWASNSDPEECECARPEGGLLGLLIDLVEDCCSIDIDIPPCFDFTWLTQYPAAHLEVDILAAPYEVHVCDEFTVVAAITNTGEADAWEASATLSVFPEGSVRVTPDSPQGGYTQYIGTIPGHGSGNNTAILRWNVHCKEPCESTITITAEGYDEYGWHQKQQCQTTGSFYIEDGYEYFEVLEEWPDLFEQPMFGGGDTAWTYGYWIGDAVGLIGPFNFEADVQFAMLGGGPDVMGRINGMGMVIPDTGMGGMMMPKHLCCNRNVDDDVMLWLAHISLEEPLPDYNQGFAVGAGLLQVINGNLSGVYLKGFEVNDREPPEDECFFVPEWEVGLFNGTFCSTMAATAGLPIQERFIEPASVTVKQHPSEADLEVSKIVSDGEPLVGDDVDFTITVTNWGPSDATGLQVTDVLPDGLSYVSHDTLWGWYNPDTGVWDIGELPGPEDMTVWYAELTITATVTDAGTITNMAVVTAADQHDPVLTDNAATATVESERTAHETWDIELDEGWNLISLPLMPDSTNPADVLDPANVDPDLGEEDIVWGYDPSTGWDDWVPTLGGPLAEIRDGWGYWVDISEATGAAILTVNGEELPTGNAVPPSYDVVVGWNLIGFKSTAQRTAGEYLAGIEGKYTIIYGYDDGAYFIVQSTDLMDPTLGYWIAVTVDGTIYP